MLIRIDRDDRAPLYVQIADQLRFQILSGALDTGSRLPPTREVSEALKVNRKTVVSAYRLLRSEGLVSGCGRGGTVVAGSPNAPEREWIRPVLWSHLYSDVVRPASTYYGRSSFSVGDPLDLPPGTLSLTGEVSRYRWGSADTLRAAIEDVILEANADGLPRPHAGGFAPLRETLSRRARMMGASIGSDRLMITAGRQQGIYLLAQAFLEKGDSVAMEVPSYVGAIHAFKAHGAQIHAVPLDAEGPDLSILEGVLSRHRVKLIYVAPTFRDPTGTTMSLQRRKDLLDLAHRYRVPILEDDAYQVLRYEGDPLPPLFALDRKDQTLYVSTLEYELPLGLHVGWVAAPSSVIESLVPLKRALEFQTHPIMQKVAHRVLTERPESIRSIVDSARRSRDAMFAALESYCSQGLSFRRPEGGAFVWAELREVSARSELCRKLLDEGVLCSPGYRFFPDENCGAGHLRLDFLGVAPHRIDDAVRRLGFALNALPVRSAQ